MSEPTVTIRVTTNADQAAGQLKRATQDLKSAGSGGRGTAGGAPVGGDAQERMAHRRSAPQSSGRNASSNAQAGSIASAGMKNFTLGMGLQFAGQGVDLLAHTIGNQEGGSRTGSRLAAIGGGAAAGAAAGAMFGGPVGAAIGGVVGGLIGAFKQLSDEAKSVREGLQGLKVGAQVTISSASANRQDEAFFHQLKWKSKTERMEALDARSKELSSGGDYSIVEIRKRMEKAVKEEKTDTDKYKRDEQLLKQQESRLLKLYSMRTQETMAPEVGLTEASKYVDSLGAMGGSIGPQVDVADVNHSILEEIKRLNATMEVWAKGSVSENLVDRDLNEGFGGVYTIR